MAATSDPIPLTFQNSSAPFRSQLEARAPRLQPGPHVPAPGDPALVDTDIDDAATTAVMSPHARIGMAFAALTLLTIGIAALARLPDDAPAKPTASTSPHAAAPPGQRLEEPLDVSALFAQGFLRHTRTEEHEATLASALDAPINVVNLWATWCEPCKREMPALGERIARHPGVNLITLRVLDMSPWEWGPLVDLPPTTEFFSEPSALSRALKALGELHQSLPVDDAAQADASPPLGHSVPITLVVDCRERLHWHHTGELTEERLDNLAATLDELSKLPIECPPRPRTTSPRRSRPAASTPQGTTDIIQTTDTTSTTGGFEHTTDILEPTTDQPQPEPDEYLAPRPKSSACGDGHCRPRRGEDCYTCPDDCGCKNGYHCAGTSSADARRGDEWKCEPNTDVNLLRD